MKIDGPTVEYSLLNPIKPKIFNFDKFVSNLDVKVFLQENTIFPCNGVGSGFIDRVTDMQ